MCVFAGQKVKWNVAVYKDLNLEFVTKNNFCHGLTACKNAIKHVYNVHKARNGASTGLGMCIQLLLSHDRMEILKIVPYTQRHSLEQYRKLNYM